MGLTLSSSSSSSRRRLPLTSPFSSSSSSPSKWKFPLSILNNSSFSSLPTESKSNSNSAPCCSLASNTNVPEPSNAIDRVVLRLRNLGLASLDDEPPPTSTTDHFLRREWVRPDATLPVALPWDKEEQQEKEEKEDKWLRKKKKKMNKMGKEAPTMAGMTLGEEELKRLRTLGMQHVKKERVSVPKAGLTRPVLDQIHRHWNNNELVKLKFHEHLAHNMNLAHRIVEHRTGGLVIWRSGSVMFVYRGKNYQHNEEGGEDDDRLHVPRLSPDGNAKSEPVVWWNQQGLTAEEVEFDRMLDGFGPRFVDWWGTGILPVDADLLPPTVPGYRTPLRLLAAGMHRRLTNDEVTNMRKLAKALPCHFALGRNRNLQGLACAILKLWEKSLVAKIAVKRGVQNTNNELMAQELKNLTGGTLLLRNKYYIVIYRGKDFIPTSVAAVVAERQELTKQVQDVEVKVQHRAVGITPLGEDETTSQAGSLAEFYEEAQSHWGRDISTEEHEKMMKEAAKAKNVRLVKKIEHKLAVAQAKRLRAEKLLAKIEVSMVPSGPCNNRETITDEERVMFRAVGLRMKAYLQLGTRGVFDGVVENMHLHWKHRELVKLITKQKILAFVEDTARLLEYESGGILVAIDRLPKGFSLIYYCGKNYRRPITLRPRNFLTKAKALQHSIAMQRHEALSDITKLGEKIQEMKKELHEDEESDGDDNGGDFDDTEDTDWDDEDSEFSIMENDGLPVKAG